MENVNVQETIAAHTERLRGLERWQDDLSGALMRLEQKLDGFKNWFMGALFTGLVAILVEVIKLLSGK